jgi:hypothetical protein
MLLDDLVVGNHFLNHSVLFCELLDSLLKLGFQAICGLVVLLSKFFLNFGFLLKLFQVCFQVLYSLTEVLVTFAYTNWLITVLHVLLLQELDFIFVVFFVLLHSHNLNLDLPVLSLLFGNLDICVCHLIMNLFDKLFNSLNLRYDVLFGFGLFVNNGLLQIPLLSL